MQGTIHILRKHIFRIFGPPTPYVSMLLILKISKNWSFLTPFAPTSPYVIYEWSPVVVGDQNNVRKLGKISQACLVCWLRLQLESIKFISNFLFDLQIHNFFLKIFFCNCKQTTSSFVSSLMFVGFILTKDSCFLSDKILLFRNLTSLSTYSMYLVWNKVELKIYIICTIIYSTYIF